ncbi:MAG: acetyl-CoA carboxylase biotin carboxyl carrier protein subunit, partial [Aequoribacter sp.]
DSQEESIQAFKLQREQAFVDELARWHRDGQFHFEVEEAPELTQSENWPQGAILVDSPVSGSVWQHSVAEGDTVVPGQTLVVLESMKMEIPVVATRAGRVYRLPLGAGARITAGQTLCVLKETSNEA